MEALRRSICGAPAQEKTAKKSGKKAPQGLERTEGDADADRRQKKAKETSAKTTSKPQRKSA
jgi:hypothetical protein